MVKVLAGIVTFNPDIDRLKNNITAILPQVDQLVIVDNGSKNIDIIEELTESLTLIKLYKNKGIAAALNVIGQYAIDHEYEWFLTLDQDTVVRDNLIETYLHYTHLPQIGLLSIGYKDLNKEENSFKDNNNVVEKIDLAITSGTLMNTKSFKQTKGFDDKMFIDLVDFDICIQLKRLGYYIYQLNLVGFFHEIGEGKERLFRGRTVFVYNHSAFRKYYIARNSIYLIKKYGWNKDTRKMFIFARDELGKVVFFEEHKWQKIYAMMKGFIVGLFMKVG